MSVFEPIECYFGNLVPRLDSASGAARKLLLNAYLALRFLKATQLDSGFIDSDAIQGLIEEMESDIDHKIILIN